jgi:hypothetical protein
MAAPNLAQSAGVAAQFTLTEMVPHCAVPRCDGRHLFAHSDAAHLNRRESPSHPYGRPAGASARSARGECRYADYGTWRTTFGGPATLAVTIDIRMRTHTALFGLAYTFTGFRP